MQRPLYGFQRRSVRSLPHVRAYWPFLLNRTARTGPERPTMVPHCDDAKCELPQGLCSALLPMREDASEVRGGIRDALPSAWEAYRR